MDSRTPRYVELADELATRWSRLRPGSLVESEHQLAAEFGVGRLTAREAVRELERRLLVRRVMGSGTFTAHRVVYRVALGDVPSFRRLLAASGHDPGVRPVATGWRGRGVTRRFEVERLLTIDGLVAACTRDRFGVDVGQRLEHRLDDGASIVGALTELGFRPLRAGVRVAMEAPPEDIASLLEYSSAVPLVWRLESATRDGDDGATIHRSAAWLRPDMFELTVHLGDQHGLD